MHTPSTPTVSQPASTTDPRYSTSGILNSQTKEKNRQGLLSTLGGRTGNVIDINKFAENKIASRDPVATTELEQLSSLYASAQAAGKAEGLATGHVKYADILKRNQSNYNKKVDAVNDYLNQYGMQSNLTKASGIHHSRTGNKYDIRESQSQMGATGEVFNEVAAEVKKQKKGQTAK